MKKRINKELKRILIEDPLGVIGDVEGKFFLVSLFNGSHSRARIVLEKPDGSIEKITSILNDK